MKIEELLKEAITEYPTNPVGAICKLATAIEMLRPNPIREARRVLWEGFAKNPDLARLYKDNIACVIMEFDNQRFNDPGEQGTRLSHEQRKLLAEQIFEFIFQEPQ